MKITELIEQLEDFKQNYGDIEVMSSSNFGDFHKTEQLVNIEAIQICQPFETGYSSSGLAFPTDPHDREKIKADAEEILVLRYTY